ncbi:uncharacterized protein PITG_11033 [Phytophthora infestans T30-4]|uniref:Peptidase A2 domain-containing protein n=1 Tax=Phytophthora infestans (strain T30-4) TaxID=403677 RepID=D0NG09_PHYIT|nr:uncharacterized protein PITG_11033 [Phytophthora infestans T30-4]EEY57210.1 hypothetical protein PITG_11033 [Phytophthora infestans T30-4]|eukprot:XP_002901820.1 hypothetical protein PITG_11033 [Phytophthora infestans T30-4]
MHGKGISETVKIVPFTRAETKLLEVIVPENEGRQGRTVVMNLHQWGLAKVILLDSGADHSVICKGLSSNVLRKKCAGAERFAAAVAG